MSKQYYCSKCLKKLDNQYYCSNCSKQRIIPVLNDSKYVICTNVENIKEYEEYTRYFVFDIDNPEYQQIKKDITDKLAAIGMNVDEWNLIFQEEFPKTDWGGLETGYVDHNPGIGFVKEIEKSLQKKYRKEINLTIFL